jgi:hypothetical protein
MLWPLCMYPKLAFPSRTMLDNTVLQYILCTLLSTLPICPEFSSSEPSLEIPHEGGLELHRSLSLNKYAGIGQAAVTGGVQQLRALQNIISSDTPLPESRLQFRAYKDICRWQLRDFSSCANQHHTQSLLRPVLFVKSALVSVCHYV